MRPWRRPRSLAARLLVGLLIVSGLGLTVSLLAGTVLLRDYLYGRAADQVSGLVEAPGLQPDAIPLRRLCAAGAPEVLPSDFRLTIVDPEGAVLCRAPEGLLGPPVPGRAELNERAGDDRAVVVEGEGGPWVTSVVALDDGQQRDGQDGYGMLSISLRDADQTVRRLTVGGLAVSGLVLLGLALAGGWVIRIGLRPLTEVREAARGIGRGDLSARVPDGAPGTEVAELTTALNAMLNEIEQGYEERRESERRIRQFAADASHELRTPLTSIKGYAQLYEQLSQHTGAESRGEGVDQSGDDELVRYRRGLEGRRDDVVRRIDTEADRMTTIVEDLLLLARLDQQPKLLHEVVDLVEVAHDVLTAARARHPERRLDLRVSGPVEITGDRGRLQQVLGNLIGNALVHTPSSVTVTIRNTDGAALLEVTDLGPGMPEQVRAHVFDRFYRADSGRPHGSHGSGLGLAIVQALVRAHAGTITCASTVEAGSRFTVTFPTPERIGPTHDRPVT